MGDCRIEEARMSNDNPTDQNDRLDTPTPENVPQAATALGMKYHSIHSASARMPCLRLTVRQVTTIMWEGSQDGVGRRAQTQYPPARPLPLQGNEASYG